MSLEEILNEQQASWGDDVWLGIVNLPGYESGMQSMTEAITLPVLQDTFEDGVAKEYGGDKWYIYVVDRAGNVRYLHYYVDLNAERERLVAEVNELLLEAE